VPSPQQHPEAPNAVGQKWDDDQTVRPMPHADGPNNNGDVEHVDEYSDGHGLSSGECCEVHRHSVVERPAGALSVELCRPPSYLGGRDGRRVTVATSPAPLKRIRSEKIAMPAMVCARAMRLKPQP